MLAFEILQEAKLNFSAADVAAAAASHEQGVIYLTMTGDGTLHLGDLWHARGDTTDPSYHGDASWRRALKLTLWVEAKRVEFRQGSIGNTLRPKVQQALRSLRDAGIIDATWTIVTTRQASGYEHGKFVSHPNPVDQQSLDVLVDKALRLSSVTADLTLYHGTSTLDWEKIQLKGLLPLATGSNTTHGSASRGKHAGNEKVLYLAGSMDKAQRYAKDRVDDWNLRLHGSQYIHDQRNDPVILAVRVPDPTRLVADDDTVNAMARQISRKLWKAKPPEEQQRIAREIGAQRGFVLRVDLAELLWRETDAGFAEIMAKLPPQVFRTWKASLTRNDQVGYRGIIPPKFIHRVL